MDEAGLELDGREGPTVVCQPRRCQQGSCPIATNKTNKPKKKQKPKKRKPKLGNEEKPGRNNLSQSHLEEREPWSGKQQSSNNNFKTSYKINSQSLEDTQVGYTSQKYSFDKYTFGRAFKPLYALLSI